jgi:predicted nuclease of predicted toxin-antitoxin system
MKLLLDENVSFRVLKHLPVEFQGSVSLKQVNLVESDDESIWTYARDNGFSILTQDADFNALTLTRGFPPKVIWLRVGNRTSEQIGLLIHRHKDEILKFFWDPEDGIIQIFAS